MNSGLVANRYARALLVFAHQQNALERVHADVLRLQKALQAELAHQGDDGILATCIPQLGPEVQQFLRVVAMNGRADNLPAMLRQFLIHYNQEKGIATASLVSAAPLPSLIKGELTQTGTQVIQSHVDKETMKLSVVAVGRPIDENLTAEARRRLEHYSLGKYDLSIIQGEQTDSLMQLQGEINRIASSREAEHQRLLELSAEANSLTRQLDSYTRHERLSVALRGELKALFPQVTSLSLSRTAEATVRDTTSVRPYVVALVHTAADDPLLPEDADRLRQWLRARTDADSLVVVAVHEENGN